MVRLISQLLGLLALLLAPVPAAALAPAPSQAMETASASSHCEEGGTAAASHDEVQQQEKTKHPCCKDSISSCCPVAAAFNGPVPPARVEQPSPAHRPWADTIVPGASDPPLTEPPSLT